MRISDWSSDVCSSDLLRSQVAATLGEFPGPVSREILSGVEEAPYNLQLAIVKSLAVTSEGKDIVFNKVRKKAIFPRTLLDPATAERMLLGSSAGQKRSEDNTSELQSLMRLPYAVFCL